MGTYDRFKANLIYYYITLRVEVTCYFQAVPFGGQDSPIGISSYRLGGFLVKWPVGLFSFPLLFAFSLFLLFRFHGERLLGQCPWQAFFGGRFWA